MGTESWLIERDIWRERAVKLEDEAARLREVLETAAADHDGDVGVMAGAWLAVCEALHAVSPGWSVRYESCGRDSAVQAIRDLAAERDAMIDSRISEWRGGGYAVTLPYSPFGYQGGEMVAPMGGSPFYHFGNIDDARRAVRAAAGLEGE